VYDGTSDVVFDSFPEPAATEGHILTAIGGYKPKIRLYRTASTTAGVGAFQFVKEVEVDGITWATFTLTDDVADADLGEVCPSIHWYRPNGSMVGLVGMSNGIMVGFYGNTLCFSDPYLPHAWPTSYEISFNE
jgi:hypothetical protein